MARLTSEDRKKMPRSMFALPESKGYPVEDRGHAIAAKSRASAAEHAGRISKSTEQKIDARANKVLKKGK